MIPKMQEDDRFSEASFGSVISLHSVGSDGGYSPKPPSGTRKARTGQKRASKVKKQDSPYGQTKKSAPAKKTGRELWVSSIRQGTGMSAESSAMNSWNGGRASHTGQSKAMASTSSYLLDQLLMATGRPPKNHFRSNSFTNVRVGGNGPAYKTAEEYYDEVIELKKRINDLQRENELVKSKMHKVEEDNFAKAKYIEELINPNMQTNEMRRNVTDKKADSSAVITSLKHKLHSVERVVKSKYSELSKVKNDVKYTDIAELQLQNEIYYQEIQRLTQLLTEPQSTNTLQITSEIKKEKTPEGKIKKYNEAVQALSDDNNRLMMENITLKQDLRKAMELNAQTLNLSKDVEDMNRTELLAKISQLEQQVREEDNSGNDPETPRSKRSPSQFKRFPGKAGEEIKRLEDRENELLEEIDKQKGVIAKLKEDRSHYRKLADEYRLQLNKSGATGSGKTSGEEAGKPRSDSVLSSASSKKSSRKKSTVSLEEKEPKETKETRMRERSESTAAKTIQRNWRKHKEDKMNRERSFERRMADSYDEGISAIQAAFRGHSARERLLRARGTSARSDDDVEYASDNSGLYDDDVVLMQAAFRGHLARQDVLKRKDRFVYEVSEEEEEFERPRFRRSFDTGEPIPVRRGNSVSPNNSYKRNFHLSKENTTRSSMERESIRKRSLRGNDRYSVEADQDSDDDDDDVVIGSSTSLNSNDRFEQSYLSRYKTDSKQRGYQESHSPAVRMSSIREEKHKKGEPSLNNLAKGSTSWGSMRKSNLAEFLSDTEDDDVVTASSQRKNSDRLSAKKNSSTKQTGKSRESDTRRKESMRLADRWASSGSQRNTNGKKQDKSLITARASSSQWQRPSLNDNDDDEDDDDLVIAPSMSKQKRRELEDELM